MLRQWIAFVDRHPHEFSIQYPPRPEYFRSQFLVSAGEPSPPPPPPKLLYLHVPFCELRCSYCDFAVDTSADPARHRAYVDALICELDSHGELERADLQGIDLGGGTPTLLATEHLVRILERLQDLSARCAAHDFPLSLETTPAIAAADAEKMAVLVEHGAHRISMGIQSSKAATLEAVNRHRQVTQFGTAMANLRAAGFRRINLDVIFGLPGQTLAEWREDLNCLIQLAPDSITTYDCLYRGEGRALSHRSTELPSPRAYGAMYDAGFDTLTSAGYHAVYGSLNFARRRGETGTSAYFQGRLLEGAPYLGLGNYATTLIGRSWCFNVPDVRQYIDRVRTGATPRGDCYLLPQDEVDAKYVLGSLNFGIVDESRFARVSPRPFREAYAAELELAQLEGWLSPDGPVWKLAPGAFWAMPRVRALFYPPRARAWMRASEKNLLA